MSDESESLAEPPKEFPKPESIQNEPQNQGAPNPPFIPPTDERPHENANSTDDQKKLTEWEKFDRLVKIIECVALIGGVATAIFIGYQWHEMGKASKISEKQLGVMQGQLDEMRLDERAWVFAVNAMENVSDNRENGTFRVTIRNSGKTPAFNTQCSITFVSETNQIPNKDEMDTNDESSGTGTITPDGIAFTETPAIPSQILAGLTAGKTGYLFGTIWYDDISGNHHWSQYCVSIKRSITSDKVFVAMAMTFHNSCDDIENTKKQ